MGKGVIVGGGIAGLSLLKELSHLGIDAQLLEQGNSVGYSWACMPSFLHLVSPWRSSRLLDDDSLRFGRTEKVPRAEYHKYLNEMADQYVDKISTNTKVIDVLEEKGELTLICEGGSRVSATFVVGAAGTFFNPLYPQGSRELLDKKSVRYVHFFGINDFSELVESLPAKPRVLIVGGSLSAGQVFDEFYQHGVVPEISARSVLKFGPPRILVDFYFWFTEEIEWWTKKYNPNKNIMTPMISRFAKELYNKGLITVHPEFSQLEDVAYDLVVFATGFKPNTGFLKKVENHPRVYTLGVPYEYFRSKYLRGIREDARTLAEKIGQTFR